MFVREAGDDLRLDLLVAGARCAGCLAKAVDRYDVIDLSLADSAGLSSLFVAFMYAT